MPWDKAAIEESVRKTGRLVIVQEDSENCSVGQMIISHIASIPELWSAMISPPILVSKGNVMIGYNPIYEYAALPDVERIVAAIERSVATKTERLKLQPASLMPDPRPGKKSRTGIDDPRLQSSRLCPAPRLSEPKASPCRSWVKEFAPRKS